MNKIVAGIVGFLVLLVFVFGLSSIGVNDGGFRTVIQSPTGNLSVKFSEGWYFAPFSKTTLYSNVISDDLEDGISVRYQDGGMGVIDGVVRVAMPEDEAGMLNLHRDFQSEVGLINRLVKPEIKQALMQTAGLMTSEEAYAEKRSEIANWAEAQMERGRFKTEVVQKEVTMTDGSVQKKNVPVIVYDGGVAQHQTSPLLDYSLDVSGFQVTNIEFENATQYQINEKRQAEMGSITARANADRAAWEEKQVEAEGKKLVAQRRYEQLQINEKQILEAEREKEIAIIAAVRQKEVNEEQLLAAKIDVQTAQEQAKATIERASAEAKAKKLIIEADGALAQKLATYEVVMGKWADAYARRNVPSFVMGGAAEGTGGNADATQFQSMLQAMLAKSLVVDPQITK